MTKKIAVVAVLSATCLLADISYEQTSRMTGGMMAGMMKIAGAFSKQAREPIRSTVLLKGNRMATLSAQSGHVIDLDRETITEIDFQKRTYSVITFAQMAEALKQMEAQLKSAKGEQPEMNVKASLKETGQTKQFSGVNAREFIMTLEMEGTDQQTGQKGAMVVTADMWVAQQPGYDQVRQFYQRMAQKLAWTPGGGMFTMGRSDMARAMADLQKEAAKLDGVPVYQVVKMGFKGEAGQAAQAGQAPPAPQPQAQPQAQEQPSVGGALGRLGGRLGGLGGLGRRKKAEQPAEQPAPPPESAPAAAQPDVSGALMEMTTELTSFSTGPVDPSKLEAPGGFKQVESQMLKGMRR